METYDYIIVGGGSAGCVLANRLSVDPGIKVLLIEAGGPDGHPLFHVPAGFAKMTRGIGSWGWHTVPQKHLGQRVLRYTQARVLGGGSSINAQLYTRGAPADYDEWVSRDGAAGWSFAEVLPYFRRSENNQRFANAFHAYGGPLGVSNPASPLPICEAFFQAGQELGIPFNPDFNGATQEGLGYYQLTQLAARRLSAATGFLDREVRARTNLAISLRTRALRVVIEGGRACGVEIAEYGAPATRVARAQREVIVASGAIGSPKLLMHSGIGPADHLREVGVEVLHDLPGVGQNLSEHPIIGMVFRSSLKRTFLSHLRFDRAVLGMMQWYLTKTGPFATNAAPANIFFRTPNVNSARPDIQMICSSVGLDAQLWFPGVTAPPVHRFAIGPNLLHPLSRGWVKLRSSDPTAAPRIFFNMYSEKQDLDCMVEGVKRVREIYNSPPLGDLITGEIKPGEGIRTDAEIEDWVRRNSDINQHPVGTCRMGVDDQAVVDATLKVRGIEGLRVVDASVMPDEPGGNTNLPTIMIAEKGADMIRGRPALAPIN